MQRKSKTRPAPFKRCKQDAKKPTFSVMVGGMSAAYWAGLHPIRLVQCQQAPLMDAMATQRVYITLIVCRPAGATLDPEPRGRHDRPLRVRLPPAMKHPMRGDVGSHRGTEACRHNLLTPSLFLWVAKLCHLKHQIEQLTSMLTNEHKQGT